MKNAVWFVLGAAIGGACGYFYAKNKLEKKAQEDVDAAILAERKRYSEKNDSEKPEESDAVPRVFKSPFEKAKENYSFTPGGTYYVDYSKPVNNEEKESEEDEEEEDDGTLYPKEGNNKEPYGITPEEFANENPYFDKQTLYYYQADDILTEDFGQIVQDPTSLLGYDFESEIGKHEEDVGYFRNEKVGTDYEVILEKGSFYSSDV